MSLSATSPVLASPEVTPAQDARIALQNRKPFALMLITPSGLPGKARSVEILDSISNLLEKNTDFRLESFDPEGASACEGRLACLTRQVRTDYNRLEYELPDGTLAPYEEHLAFLSRRKKVYPEYFMVVSHLTGGPTDQLEVVVLHTDRILRIYHTANRQSSDWRRGLEITIRDQALVAPPKTGQITDSEDVSAFFKDLFFQNLRRPLTTSRHWRPYGAIQIQSPVAGQGIILDGITVGTTQSGITHIEQVPAGQHELALEHPEYYRFETNVEVAHQDTQVITVELKPKGSASVIALRQGLIWGGLAVTAAGVAMTTVALGTQDDTLRTYCTTPNCGGQQFTTTGYNATPDPSFDDSVNPNGVLLGPLGYSLALTGAAWSLTTLLIGDESDIPWLQITSGLVLGGLAYGLSHALSTPSPF